MSSVKNRRIRNKLFKKNPYCPKCGIKMILMEDVFFEEGKKKSVPNNVVTLEHVFSKLNPKRKWNNPKIILCRGCNQANNMKDQESYGNIPADLKKTPAEIEFFNKVRTNIIKP